MQNEINTAGSDDTEAALALAELAGVAVANGDDNNPPAAEQDPSNEDHVSESSSDDDNDTDGDGGDDPIDRERTDNAPSGLFGEAEGHDAAATTTAGENKYQRRYRVAWEHIKRLEGQVVKERAGMDAIDWQVVGSESVTDDVVGPDGFCGVKPQYGFEQAKLNDAFLLMWPGDIWAQWAYMKQQVETIINPARRSQRKRPI